MIVLYRAWGRIECNSAYKELVCPTPSIYVSLCLGYSIALLNVSFMHEIKQLHEKTCWLLLSLEVNYEQIRCFELHECLFRDVLLIIQCNMPRWQVQEFWMTYLAYKAEPGLLSFDPLPIPIFFPLSSICNLNVGYIILKLEKEKK